MPRGVAAAVFSAVAIALTGCGGGNDGSAPSGPAAMTGYVIITGTTATIGETSGTTVTASCPSGKVATGGGYTTMNEAANVFDNFPASGGAGWTVSAKNENLVSTGGGIVVTPFAVCADRPAGYELRTGSITLGHQHVADGEARCLDATYALLGGGVSTGDSQVHPFTTASSFQASQPTWASAFKSNYSVALPSSSSATTTVICASLSAAPGRAEVTSASTALGPKSKASLSVTCPTGKKALSGGLTSAESPAIWFDSSPAGGGTGWTASLHNQQSPLEPVTLHATISVICATAN
jgi:hypothetical protein